MANYLRHNKRAELKQERQAKRTQKTTTVSHNECPYCLSRSLEHHGNTSSAGTVTVTYNKKEVIDEAPSKL